MFAMSIYLTWRQDFAFPELTILLAAHAFKHAGPGFAVSDHQAVTGQDKRPALVGSGITIANIALDPVGDNSSNKVYRICAPIGDRAVNVAESNFTFISDFETPGPNMGAHLGVQHFVF